MCGGEVLQDPHCDQPEPEAASENYRQIQFQQFTAESIPELLFLLRLLDIFSCF